MVLNLARAADNADLTAQAERALEELDIGRTLHDGRPLRSLPSKTIALDYLESLGWTIAQQPNIALEVAAETGFGRIAGGGC